MKTLERKEVITILGTEDLNSKSRGDLLKMFIEQGTKNFVEDDKIFNIIYHVDSFICESQHEKLENLDTEKKDI